MHRVLVSDTLNEQGLAILRRGEGLVVDYRPGLGEADLAEAVKGADALVIRSGSRVTARVLAAQDRVALEIAEQVVAFLARGEIKNAVNVPQRTALSVWTLDQAMPEPLLEAIRRSPNVERALALQL